LEGWLEHLVGHDKNYRDYPSDQTKEELIGEINEAINNIYEVNQLCIELVSLLKSVVSIKKQ
jgi:hypothetical protein